MSSKNIKDVVNAITENEKKIKQCWYTLEPIKKLKAHYNIIFGERSNGKTFSVLCEMVEQYFKNGIKTNIFRRYEEDFKGNRASTYFTKIVKKGKVFEITHGKWQDIIYKNRAWWLCRKDEDDNIILDTTPFAYAHAISSMEHDKGNDDESVGIILFDEFLTRTGYLPNEFVLFQNCISTTVRERDNVVIYMLGNTVNKYCPYFNEMGLRHIRDMKEGEIDLYTFGDLRIAVEYTGNKISKKSDIYFSFDNPALDMIKNGKWETLIYPHLTEDYKQKDIFFTSFIEFDGEILQIEYICEEGVYLYIHQKTSPIKYKDDFIISDRKSPSPYVISNIYGSNLDIIKLFRECYNNDKILYQDNETGEIVRNMILSHKKRAV